MTEIYLTASLVVYKPDFSVLKRTLDALQQAFIFARQKYPLRFELTLVDNSNDREWAKRIETWLAEYELTLDDWKIYLLNPEGNLGYGCGNNLVIDKIESDYHLVINPDLFFEPDTLYQMLNFMQRNPDAGLLVPSTFGEDGQRQYLCKRHPTLLIMFLRSFAPAWLQFLFKSTHDKFEMRDYDYEGVIDVVQYPSGCCMFFRTQPLQQIKGFDPNYFLHYEDADIGRRLSMVAKIVYVPNVRVIHRWARDTHHSWKMRLITVRSGLTYWRKWGGTLNASPSHTYVKNDIKQTETARTQIANKVLVTGATGFIGRRLCEKLIQNGYTVHGAVRQTPCPGLISEVKRIVTGSLDQHVDWFSALSGVETVVHLAARVHVMHEFAEDPLFEFRKVNVMATINLARQAALMGVKRFIFISSVKVNGESTPADRPFTTEDMPFPADFYGVSKYEAEIALSKIAEETGMELVIIRPVLVYGPGVKGNFLELMRWLEKGPPFPFGSMRNQRSLVSLDNLVDFILTCLKHPKAANQTFFVSDGVDLSMPELLKMTAAAMNKNVWLIPVPLGLMKGMGRLLGKEVYIQRICESLRVDISKNRQLVGWTPKISVEIGLKETVLNYLAIPEVHKSLALSNNK